MADDATESPDFPPIDVAAQAKVDQLDRQVADYKLLVAELQTSLRRLTQDADRQRKYAAEPLARDLLTGLDNLGRAADAARAAGESGPLAQGVAATIAQFLDILKRYGVSADRGRPGVAVRPEPPPGRDGTAEPGPPARDRGGRLPAGVPVPRPGVTAGHRGRRGLSFKYQVSGSKLRILKLRLPNLELVTL